MGRFVPNLLVADVLARRGVEATRVDPNLDAKLRAGLESLAGSQREDGGWGWYQAHASDATMTAHVVWGLEECARLGHPGDAIVLARGKQWLSDRARTETDPEVQAHIAFALGAPIERLEASASPRALALQVLAQVAAGRRDATAGAVARLVELASDDHWLAPAGVRALGDADLEATTYAMRALAAYDPAHPLLARAAAWLLGQRQGGRWRSTYDTALAIVALLPSLDTKLLAAELGEAPDAQRRRPKSVALMLDGEPVGSFDLEPGMPLRARLHRPGLAPGAHRLEVACDRTLDLELDVACELESPPFDAAAGPLTIAVEYDRTPEALHLGQEVVATVTVRATADVEHATIESPIPAGCEPVRGSGEGIGAEIELRHDRALFYVKKIAGGQAETYRYRMVARNAGRFHVRAPRAEPMYDEERGSEGVARVAVVNE